MPPGRKKPKIIHPLPKPDRAPLPDFDKLEGDEPKLSDEMQQTNAENDSGEDFPGVKPDPPKRSFKLPSLSEHLLPDHTANTQKWFTLRWPPSRREWIISGVLLVAAIFAIGSYLFLNRPQPGHDIVVTVKAPKIIPKTVPSTLTGLPVDPSVNKRPVTAVMIENSLDARPQSGLDKAGVVFEAIAEGGITRFMALYQDTAASYIGPVRSSRPYYVEWALGFDAGYAHVGGSPEALQDIKNWHVRDLDQFYNSGAYQRISSRYAPHNVYTSISSLNAVEKSKGYTTSNYTGFVRKPAIIARNSSKTPKTNQPALPAATSIDLNFSGYYYNVHYSYDAKTNTYKRSEGGQPHMELSASGKQTQIAPTVVLGLVMPYHLEADGYHSYYNTIGSGPLYVFQDGTVQQGTWHKTSRTSQLTFTDASGKAIPLDPGQTWVSALRSTGDVSYK